MIILFEKFTNHVIIIKILQDVNLIWKGVYMEKQVLKRRLDVASGRIEADLVIKNCKVVNVFSGNIVEKNIAICDGIIAGVGEYSGKKEIDAHGRYVLPGLIESHMHIESTFVTPEEVGRLLVPHGTTTIIADPHEIVNVAGRQGLKYMLDAADNTPLDIKYVLPSCVPATPFEHSGAVLNAEDMKELIKDERILGLGEFMNFTGVISAEDSVLDKLLVSINEGKIIDGHCPGITGNELNAYTVAGVTTDHECTTVEEMYDRINNGMYVQLRQGSACHELAKLLKGVTMINSRRCVLCSDDRQPKTIFEEGHLDGHLRICVNEGIDAITAIQMATINAAECYGLSDRGAIAPGRRADLIFVNNLESFDVQTVLINGEIIVEEGKYLQEVKRNDISPVMGSVRVKDFSVEKLKLHLKTSKVNVIDLLPESIVTKKGIAEVDINNEGDFVYNPDRDICKMAVIERHNGTGSMSVGLIRGYGIKAGAIAVTVTHDSHNIIVAGTNNEDMFLAVSELIRQQGGAIIVCCGKILETLPLPVAGIMSDQSGEWVDERLVKIHSIARRELSINEGIDPLMTLCFMALPVIPEVKLTDMGLFDVTKFEFIPVEAE